MPPQEHDWQSILQRIAEAKSETELAAIDHELFSRKHGALTLALKELVKLPPTERRTNGDALNKTKRQLEGALSARAQALSEERSGGLQQDRIDPTLTLPKEERGHLHPIPEFIRSVEEIFGQMGFDVADGPEAESEELNFTKLNIPPEHPARDMQGTFWLRQNGKLKMDNEKFVMRTHTSPVQVRYMQSHKPPFRMICPGKVYRKDADATHSPMFHQFEGLMVGEDVSLANMKAVMIESLKALLAPDITFRFRSSYFPFVEPGLEVDIRWETKGTGTFSAENVPVPVSARWLEVVGCGMVHPNVLKYSGIDPAKWRGFAFGFGVERLLMIKYGIPDLRLFYEGDLRFLRQF